MPIPQPTSSTPSEPDEPMDRPAVSARTRGVVLVLLGAVLWGTTGTAQALGPDSAGPLAVGTTRLVAGGGLLTLWMLISTRGLSPRGRSTRGLSTPGSGPVTGTGARPTGRPVLPVLAGAIGVAAYQLSFFAAVDRAGVAVGTAVAIGSSPVFTGLIEWAVRRQAPTARWWRSTTIATAGLVLLAGPGGGAFDGIGLALVAGLSYATYAVASKQLLDRWSPAQAMAAVFGGGAVLLLPLLVGLDLGWLADWRGVAMLLWLAGPTILVAYLLFGAGLREVTAAVGATLSLAEPLTAAILAVGILAERPSVTQVVGAAAIGIGLGLLAVPDRRVRTTPTG
ncbi:DMT family transporter [Euzebya pacifica]|uniref:DMT family transporter n=1 Tax=Euzebya pacifica TaxID=1608957 RepID=UPI0030F5164B